MSAQGEIPWSQRLLGRQRLLISLSISGRCPMSAFIRKTARFLTTSKSPLNVIGAVIATLDIQKCWITAVSCKCSLIESRVTKAITYSEVADTASFADRNSRHGTCKPGVLNLESAYFNEKKYRKLVKIVQAIRTAGGQLPERIDGSLCGTFRCEKCPAQQQTYRRIPALLEHLGTVTTKVTHPEQGIEVTTRYTHDKIIFVPSAPGAEPKEDLVQSSGHRRSFRLASPDMLDTLSIPDYDFSMSD